jgi:sec-independent protein translocase protein TatA
MIGTGELLVILCLVLILFGGKRLPELARSIGLGIREFKKACHGIEEDDLDLNKPASKKKQPEPVVIEVENEHEKR